KRATERDTGAREKGPQQHVGEGVHHSTVSIERLPTTLVGICFKSRDIMLDTIKTFHKISL
ncbi:MAG: hypothetical protein OXE40_02200, partial [Gammaproteobacteria bacterium]|nr:hypothetical protein [Gammaproteobacteria bacterium]